VAKFIGTMQEFHHFIGPRIRNAVNQAARVHRNELGGICESCGQQAELQSAHIHGRDRRTIIETVLINSQNRAGLVECDLEETEKLVINAHLPIKDTFKFLCHPCHVSYDSGTRNSLPVNKRSPYLGGKGTSGNGEFRKIGRIKLWASRPNQINHQIIRAFMQFEQGGVVKRSLLKDYCTQKLGISGFDGAYASMKTDAGNAHGKVFFDDGDVVRMWPRVRVEVDKYFQVLCGQATSRLSA